MGSASTISFNGSSKTSSIRYSKAEILNLENRHPIIPALNHPFESISSIMEFSDFLFPSDAKIVVDGNREIPIDSHIFFNKSPFFKKLFRDTVRGPRGWKIEMKELTNDFHVGYDALVVVVDYLYTGKVTPRNELKRDVRVMAEVLYASFIFQIPEMVVLYQNHLLSILDEIAIDSILTILHVAHICGEVCERLLMECIKIVVKYDIGTTLEMLLPCDIQKKIMDSRLNLFSGEPRNEDEKSINKASDHEENRLKLQMRRFMTNVRNDRRKYFRNLGKGWSCCKSF